MVSKTCYDVESQLPIPCAFLSDSVLANRFITPKQYSKPEAMREKQNLETHGLTPTWK